MDKTLFRPCVIIPVCKRCPSLPALVEKITRETHPIILVDDGTEAASAEELDTFADLYAHVTVVRHAKSEGEGAAVCSGITCADNMGFTHALQVDAGEQSDISDIEALLQAAQNNPRAIIGRSLSKGKEMGRLADRWVRLLTKLKNIPDAFGGFRVYPVASLIEILKSSPVALGSEFRPQILIYASWSGIPVVSLPLNANCAAKASPSRRSPSGNIRISLLCLKMWLRHHKKRIPKT